VPPKRLDAAAPGFEKDFSDFLGRNRDSDENVDRVVADIIADVRARGDAAVVDYTRKFDWPGAELSNLRLSDAERRAAAAKVPPAQRDAGTLCIMDACAGPEFSGRSSNRAARRTAPPCLVRPCRAITECPPSRA